MLRQNAKRKKIGVFSLKSRSAEVTVPAPDGRYQNLIDGETVAVENGTLRCTGKPIIFSIER